MSSEAIYAHKPHASLSFTSAARQQLDTYEFQDRTPYVYCLEWLNELGSLMYRYVGCRYAKGCHPRELFVKYFTSSPTVAGLIQSIGLPQVIEIRRVFVESQDALDWETKFLRKVNARDNDLYVNKHNNELNFGTKPWLSQHNILHNSQTPESRKIYSERMSIVNEEVVVCPGCSESMKKAKFNVHQHTCEMLEGEKKEIASKTPEFRKFQTARLLETVSCPLCGEVMNRSKFFLHHKRNCGELVGPKLPYHTTTKEFKNNKSEQQRNEMNKIVSCGFCGEVMKKAEYNLRHKKHCPEFIGPQEYDFNSSEEGKQKKSKEQTEYVNEIVTCPYCGDQLKRAKLHDHFRKCSEFNGPHRPYKSQTEEAKLARKQKNSETVVCEKCGDSMTRYTYNRHHKRKCEV